MPRLPSRVLFVLNLVLVIGFGIFGVALVVREGLGLEAGSPMSAVVGGLVLGILLVLLDLALVVFLLVIRRIVARRRIASPSDDDPALPTD